MPAPHTEVRTIDKEGNVCDYDVPGELQVKGPQVMAGYWKIDRDDDDHPLQMMAGSTPETLRRLVHKDKLKF